MVLLAGAVSATLAASPAFADNPARRGFTMRVTTGLGAQINTQHMNFRLDLQPRLENQYPNSGTGHITRVYMSPMVTFQLGGYINPRLAIFGQGGVSFDLAKDHYESGLDTGVVFSGGVAVQYWMTDRFHIIGGLGVAFGATESFYYDDVGLILGPALSLEAGYAVATWGKASVSLFTRYRGTAGFHERRFYTNQFVGGLAWQF